MYRAECTNCISQVANIYDMKKHPIVKEGKLCLIDVETEEEKILIERMDRYYSLIFGVYSRLVEIKSGNRK